MTTHEIDLYGIFLPPFLVWAVVAALCLMAVRPLLDRYGVLPKNSLRPLMEVSLFIIFLFLASLLFSY